MERHGRKRGRQFQRERETWKEERERIPEGERDMEGSEGENSRDCEIVR